ncbi:MAG TPA: hypothetical protein VGZ26_02415, partial [Pirellulales bacterium]|nr:hypothetical protein [Pirellulales bacterium]
MDTNGLSPTSAFFNSQPSTAASLWSAIADDQLRDQKQVDDRHIFSARIDKNRSSSLRPPQQLGEWNLD